MNSIPQLVKSIQTKYCPISELFRYKGTDWKPFIKYVNAPCPFPKTLWKSEQMELVLIGWQPNQFLSHYSGYGVVSSLVLEGNLLNDKDPLPHKFVFPPFHLFRLTSDIKCAQLLLYQVNFTHSTKLT